MPLIGGIGEGASGNRPLEVGITVVEKKTHLLINAHIGHPLSNMVTPKILIL